MLHLTNDMRKIIIYLSIFIALVGISLSVFIIKEHKEYGQYKYGMTIDDVLRMTNMMYPVEEYGIMYVNKPTRQQMQEDIIYYIYDEANGIRLSFNHHKVLIRKERIKIMGVNVNRIAESIRTMR